MYMKGTFPRKFYGRALFLSTLIGLLGLFFVLNVFSLNLFPDFAQAASIISTKSGNWSDSTVWSTGNIPTTGDTITIKPGHTVTYDVLSDSVLGELSVEGTLYFSRTASTRLKISDNILVKANGYLNMGTPTDFIPKSTKAEVIFALSQAQASAYVGGGNFEPTDKGLWVFTFGRFDSHGASLVRTWSKLAANVNAGSNTVIVENDVTDWYVGGTVAFSSTIQPSAYYRRQHDGRSFRRNSWQEELRTITSIQSLSSGKTQIILDRPLSFAHSGTGTMRGEVGLLTRNILFTTELEGYTIPDDALKPDTSQRKFAHTLYFDNSNVDVAYTEFKYMGNKGKSGRYPMHTHRAGDTSIGRVIRGNAVWISGNNGVVTHNSSGVLHEDNVFYSTSRVSMWIEINPKNQDAPKDNKFVHNLGILSGLLLDHLDQFVAGNVVSGVGSGGKTNTSGSVNNFDSAGGGYGFEWGSRSNSSGKVVPLTFIKNETHSNKDSGIRTWNNAVPAFDILDLHSWRNGRNGIFWGAYSAPYRYFNALFEESALHGASVLSIKGYFQAKVKGIL